MRPEVRPHGGRAASAMDKLYYLLKGLMVAGALLVWLTHHG